MAGRIKFSAENVKVNDYNFPKLKLKKNEVARIVLLEDPVMAYVHDLREPKLTNGIPEKVIKQRRDNTNYEDFIYNFVSRPICLGDEGTLADIGSDPVNCPVCAEAKASDRAHAPKRRFAMHVIRYATKPGSSDVQTPYSAQNLVWSFTDKVFGKIVDFQQEWGDLRKHDLILKCDNEIYQNYEMTIGAKAAWMEDAARIELTKTIFKENQAKDLVIFCGTPKEKKYIEMDLNQVRTTYNIATNTPAALSALDGATEGVGAVTLDAGLDDLLNSVIATPVAATEPKTEGAMEEWKVTAEDALAASALPPSVEDALASSALPPTAEEPKDAKEESADYDFDALLSDL